jgi:hypothetical protein
MWQVVYGGIRNAYKLLFFKPEDNGPLGSLEVNTKTDQVTGTWIGFSWFKIRQNGGFLCTQQ